MERRSATVLHGRDKSTYITFVHDGCRAYHRGSGGEDDKHLGEVHRDRRWWVAEALWVSCVLVSSSELGEVYIPFCGPQKSCDEFCSLRQKIFHNVILVNLDQIKF